jgi:hypothetical protein
MLLRELPIAAMAKAMGRADELVRALERYRDGLVEQVLTLTVPADA